MPQQNLQQIVEDFFRVNCQTSCTVCVAVSGGGDSVALFHLFREMQSKLSISRIGIAHVNHRIRGRTSDGDATFVRRVATRAGVRFHLHEIDKKDVPGSGIEEWARNVRYSFFDKIRKKFGYTYVATAHTENDQAETVLLRLLRGSGIHGLCGIAPVRDDGIIRPLLAAKRDSLRRWLAEMKYPIREDATNKDMTYIRNWIRHAVIPLLEQREAAIVSHLAFAAVNAQTIARLIEPVTNKWINDYVVSEEEGKFSIMKRGLTPEAEAGEAVVRFLSKRNVGFTRGHVSEIVQNSRRSNGLFLLPGNWKYVCKSNVLEFAHKSLRRPAKAFSYVLVKNKDVPCKEKNCVLHLSSFRKKKLTPIDLKDSAKAFLDASKCPEPLKFRSVKKGERFWPYGAKGPVDCFEFLKKQGISSEERKTWGVVGCASGEIAWVVGLRIGHRFRVTAATKDIHQISCKPKT
jgi:tRNA(Ile)-lysidine synthase